MLIGERGFGFHTGLLFVALNHVVLHQSQLHPKVCLYPIWHSFHSHANNWHHKRLRKKERKKQSESVLLLLTTELGLKNTLVPRLGQTSPEAQGLGFRFRV
jgi:hypothetical protein